MISLRRQRAPAAQRGSMLVPVVAAMLVLMMAGVSLSEATGAQRMQSAWTVHATRAYWIAEAGLWHAHHEGAAPSSPVAFAGGQYTVTGSSGTFTSLGELSGAARTVSYTPRGTTTTVSSPIDVAASAATSTNSGRRRAQLNLVSVSTIDVEIESFELDADSPGDLVWRVSLDSTDIFRDDNYPAIPTGVQLLNRGSSAQRTVTAGDDPLLSIRFRNRPAGTVEYTLTLQFTDGTNAVVPFTIAW